MAKPSKGADVTGGSVGKIGTTGNVGNAKSSKGGQFPFMPNGESYSGGKNAGATTPGQVAHTTKTDVPYAPKG